MSQKLSGALLDTAAKHLAAKDIDAANESLALIKHLKKIEKPCGADIVMPPAHLNNYDAFIEVQWYNGIVVRCGQYLSGGGDPKKLEAVLSELGRVKKDFDAGKFGKLNFYLDFADRQLDELGYPEIRPASSLKHEDAFTS